MAERMVEANGVELCTEPFGDPGDPPILLIMGSGASMLWWEEGFCRMLADARAVRDPLRPSRHRPFGHLRAGPPRVHGRRPGRRRRRRARRLRDPGRAHRRCLGGRGDRAGARARLPRSRSLARPRSAPLARSPGAARSRRRPRSSAVRVDGGGGLVGSRVGDRVPGRLLARARGRTSAHSTRRRARDLVRRDIERARDFAGRAEPRC